MFYGARGISVGSQNDIQKATARLDLMVNQLSMYSRSKLDYRQFKHDGAREDAVREVEHKSDELYSRTLDTVADYRPWMTKLKDTLMERYVLSKDEVFELIGELQVSDPMAITSAESSTVSLAHTSRNSLADASAPQPARRQASQQAAPQEDIAMAT